MLTWLLLVLVAMVTLLHHGRREPESPKELASALLDAAARRHPDDPRLRLARHSIREVHADSAASGMVNLERKTVRRGKFDRLTGNLYVSVVNSAGAPLPMQVVRNVVVHEVAHAAMQDGRHSPEWREMYVALLRVATEDLGWQVSLGCSSCRFYRVCRARDCPLCVRTACRAPR